MNTTNLESDLDLDAIRSKTSAFTYGRYLALDQIRKIDLNEYPLIVLADNARGFFSFGVKVRTRSYYGHMMWLVGPDALASQSFYYKLCTLKDYATYSMKLIHNPTWTENQRKVLITAIMADITKPWYKTLYDVPGIIGQLFGIDWFNLNFLNYCSERGNYLKFVDPEYKLDHPSPEDLDKWTKEYPNKYKVYGRYSPG